MSGVSEADVVSEVLAGYFSCEGADSHGAATVRRLDQLTRQLEYVECDQAILIEMLALFIRDYLSTPASATGPHQEAARARGSLQFEQFIDQLAGQFQRGGGLLGKVDRTCASQASALATVGRKRVVGSTEAAA